MPEAWSVQGVIVVVVGLAILIAIFVTVSRIWKDRTSGGATDGGSGSSGGPKNPSPQ